QELTPCRHRRYCGCYCTMSGGGVKADHDRVESGSWPGFLPEDGPSALAHAGAAEALAPARQHVLVVDIVGDAALERGNDRARRPVDALAQLAAFRIGRRVR